MTIPVSTTGGGTGTTPYTANPFGGSNGWYVLSFIDGAIALVYLKNHVWQWEGGPPTGNGEFSAKYIGALSTDPTADMQAGLQTSSVPRWFIDRMNAAIRAAGATGKQQATYMSLIDHGIGTSAVIAPNGSVTAGATKTGSGAIPASSLSGASNATRTAITSAANTVSGAFSGAFSFLGFLGSLSFWKGLGLIIGGAAILVFAALEFRKL
jgi:hypothetical protein